MPIVECAVGRAKECLVHLAGGERGGEWQVAAGESLGEAEEIRNHTFFLAGKHGSGAAEAGHDFIEDQLNAMHVAPCAQLCQHADWPWSHFVDALDERLDHHGRNLAQFAVWQAAQSFERIHMPHGVAVAFEALEKPVHAAQRCRAERVAVIAVGKGDEVFSLCLTALLTVLQRKFQRALDSGRAIVGVEHPLKRVRRKKTAKFFRKLDG